MYCLFPRLNIWSQEILVSYGTQGVMLGDLGLPTYCTGDVVICLLKSNDPHQCSVEKIDSIYISSSCTYGTAPGLR